MRQEDVIVRLRLQTVRLAEEIGNVREQEAKKPPRFLGPPTKIGEGSALRRMSQAARNPNKTPPS